MPRRSKRGVPTLTEPLQEPTPATSGEAEEPDEERQLLLDKRGRVVGVVARRSEPASASAPESELEQPS
jgi:hypothetical protein